MVPDGDLDMLLDLKLVGLNQSSPGSSSEREGLCVRKGLREEDREIGRSRELLYGQRDGSCITG